jgi:hypothetical protein
MGPITVHLRDLGAYLRIPLWPSVSGTRKYLCLPWVWQTLGCTNTIGNRTPVGKPLDNCRVPGLEVPLRFRTGTVAGTFLVSIPRGTSTTYGSVSSTSLRQAKPFTVNLGAGEQSGLETISGLFRSVDCISWGPGRIDLFGLNLASGVHHKAWDGNTWSEWEDLGGIIVGRATPVSHSPGALCVLVTGITCVMFVNVRDPKTGVWGGWADIGGTIVSRVA